MQVRFLAGAGIASLAAAFMVSAASAQTVTVDLASGVGGIVDFTNVGVQSQINNNQYNDGLVGTALTVDGAILFTSPVALTDSQVEVDGNLVQGLAIGNNATNAFFVGQSNCVIGNGDCSDIFDPEVADIQIGNAQVNAFATTITATVDGMQITAIFGDGTAAVAGSEVDVQVNDNTMIAVGSGNSAVNEILGDLSDLDAGLGLVAATSLTDPEGTPDVEVDGNIVIASGQLNDGTTVDVNLGAGGAAVPVTLANITDFDNFIGIQASGDVTETDGFDVLNNTAQAVANGNEVDNRIGGNLDGDGHSVVIASVQSNIGGTTVDATATNMGIGILQGGDATTFSDTVGRVNGNVIGSQAIGNNATNIVGSAGVGTF